MAFAISTHMVAGLGVGAGIGYFLDRWLGTSPGMLIAFFVLGAAAGFLNVYRTVSRYGMAFGYRPAEGVKTDAADTDMSIDEGPELPGGKKDNGA
jgi:ATP synthase protein I